MTNIVIKELDANTFEAHIPGLSNVLSDCVADGASVNFVLPFSCENAGHFWRTKVFPGIKSGDILNFTAFSDEQVVGVVLLYRDTPPNQAHRVEVGKLLVSPFHRRKGIGKKLMEALIDKAKLLEKKLITLDTVKGSNAEPLYSSIGFKTAGNIPGFSLHPSGTFAEATTYMYMELQT